MKKHIILLISFLFLACVGFSSIELAPLEEIETITTVDQLEADLMVYDFEVFEGVINLMLPYYTKQTQVVQSARMLTYKAEALNNISRLQLKEGGPVIFSISNDANCYDTSLERYNGKKANQVFDFSYNKLLKQS